MSVLEAYVAIGKLPDGRFAVENKRDLAEMTRQDMEDMVAAFATWWNVQWGLREDGSLLDSGRGK